MVSVQKWSKMDGWYELVSQGYFAPCGLPEDRIWIPDLSANLSATFSVRLINCERRQSNRSQIQHMANFPEEGHFAFEQSSAFDFPPQFPQLDLPQQQGARQDCDFHPAGYFLPLLFSVYLLCESSDGGKWLRTVIETVPFVHKKDSMCHVLCFWLVFGCICI